MCFFIDIEAFNLIFMFAMLVHIFRFAQIANMIEEDALMIARRTRKFRRRRNVTEESSTSIVPYRYLDVAVYRTHNNIRGNKRAIAS